MSDKPGVPSYLIYFGIFATVFVVALGIFLFMSNSRTKGYNLEAQKYQAPQEPSRAEAKTASSSADTLKVTIASPEDNSFVNNTNVKVAGASKAGTTISITGGTKDVVDEAESDGSFALDVGLKEGENNLVITVFDQTGQKKVLNRTVLVVLEG
jgi:hypothetical protein